jgi:hypothetical protein
MNSNQRKQQRKKQFQKSTSSTIPQIGETYWAYDNSFEPPKPEKEPEVAGINVPPVIPEFEAKVERNIWHDLPELPEWISTIQELTSKDSDWSWAKNHECKYIDIRIDMRDGGFVVLSREGDDGRRICLEHLKWQWKPLKEYKNES